MSATRPTASESAPQNGQHESKPEWKRAAHGKFAAGNRGGPGNPFARRTAKLRQAFREAITEDDLTKLAGELYERAMHGDCGAARLVLAYMLGKPDSVVDPDTLDAQEWDNCKQYYIDPDELATLVHLLPKELLCEIAKTAMPEVARHHAARLGAMIAGDTADNAESPAPPVARSPATEPECAVADESTNGHAPATPDNGKVPKANNGKPAQRRYQSGSNGATTAQPGPAISNARSSNASQNKSRLDVVQRNHRRARSSNGAALLDGLTVDRVTDAKEPAPSQEAQKIRKIRHDRRARRRN